MNSKKEFWGCPKSKMNPLRIEYLKILLWGGTHDFNKKKAVPTFWTAPRTIKSVYILKHFKEYSRQLSSDKL